GGRAREGPPAVDRGVALAAPRRPLAHRRPARGPGTIRRGGRGPGGGAPRGPPGARRARAAGALRRAANPPPAPIGTPAPRERADELAALRSWVCRRRTRVEACDGAPAEPGDGGGGRPGVP